jgi:hypothetical protein
MARDTENTERIHGSISFSFRFGQRIPSQLVASISSCLRLCNENNFGLVDGLIHAEAREWLMVLVQIGSELCSALEVWRTTVVIWFLEQDFPHKLETNTLAVLLKEKWCIMLFYFKKSLLQIPHVHTTSDYYVSQFQSFTCWIGKSR